MRRKPEDDREAQIAKWVAGLVSVILGLGLAFFYLYLPLQQARAGAQRVSWIGDWGFVSPAFIIFGIALMLFPRLGQLVESKKLRNENGTLNALGIITAIAILAPPGAACFAVNHCFESQLSQLGYVDGELIQGRK